jgi:hypothetical protein
VKIKDSCDKEKCSFWDDGKCPMYGEHKWVNDEDGQVKIVCDCVPRRTLALLMDLHSHVLGSKQYASQTRNMLNRLTEDTQNFIAKQKNSGKHIELMVNRIEERQEKMIKGHQKKFNELKKIGVK